MNRNKIIKERRKQLLDELEEREKAAMRERYDRLRSARILTAAGLPPVADEGEINEWFDEEIEEIKATRKGVEKSNEEGEE